MLRTPLSPENLMTQVLSDGRWNQNFLIDLVHGMRSWCNGITSKMTSVLRPRTYIVTSTTTPGGSNKWARRPQDVLVGVSGLLPINTFFIWESDDPLLGECIVVLAVINDVQAFETRRPFEEAE